MREKGSKRATSSSPSRRTKRQREDDSTSDSTKKSGKKDAGNKDDDERTQNKVSKTSKHDSRTGSRESGSGSERGDTSDSGSESATDNIEYHEKKVEGRYWGGEPAKEDLEEGELSSHSKEADYEVGKRYYDAKSEQKNEEEKKSKDDDNDFVVGKRYYEDKPEKGPKGDNTESETKKVDDPPVPTRKAKLDDPLLSRTGGAYIPPAKLRLMQASITDKSSISYQRIAWEALKKSIHGHINKVNTSNIGIIARLLMKENIVRGRGLLCRSLLQAQAASPTFTNVYASLVSIINSKFPNIGELLMKRVILQFKRGFKRNDKALCISSCQFIAHLVNQQVAHEIVALEMLTLLLESPTDDSVEVAVAFLKEVGQKLLELSPKGTNAIFDMLRNILHQGNLEKRVQYMIEVVFQVRKDGFRSFQSVDENLDLVEEEDRYTHILTLDEAVDPEDLLNVFKHDPDYEVNEDKYKALKEEIIGESSSEEESGGEEESGEESEGDETSDEEEQGEKKDNVTIIDETETNLVALRRTIYLTIQSSLDFEECCHKLLKMDIKPGQEAELCHMLLDCCAELRTYEKFFGLLAQRFCQINRVYITPLEEMFAGSYATVHRLDTNKLRNVARFFGHLLFTDAISWQVLQCIRLNEEETTSSSRIFIKILFQELAEYMGLSILNQRLKDPTLQTAMEGLFPRDNPKNTRFAINFFTSIGLGGLTDELREHLKTQPKQSAVAQFVDKLTISSDSSSSESSSGSSSSSDNSSDSDNESEDDGGSGKNKGKYSKKEKPEKIKEKNIKEQDERTNRKKYDEHIDKMKGDKYEQKKDRRQDEDRETRDRGELKSKEKEKSVNNDRDNGWDRNKDENRYRPKEYRSNKHDDSDTNHRRHKYDDSDENYRRHKDDKVQKKDDSDENYRRHKDDKVQKKDDSDENYRRYKDDKVQKKDDSDENYRRYKDDKVQKKDDSDENYRRHKYDKVQKKDDYDENDRRHKYDKVQKKDGSDESYRRHKDDKVQKNDDSDENYRRHKYDKVQKNDDSYENYRRHKDDKVQKNDDSDENYRRYKYDKVQKKDDSKEIHDYQKDHDRHREKNVTEYKYTREKNNYEKDYNKSKIGDRESYTKHDDHKQSKQHYKEYDRNYEKDKNDRRRESESYRDEYKKDYRRNDSSESNFKKYSDSERHKYNKEYDEDKYQNYRDKKCKKQR